MAQEDHEQFKVVGIGAQDNLAHAQRFVEQTGVTFTMLWDPTWDSWNHYGIRSNSSTWLLDRAGNRLGDRFSGPDTDYINGLLPTA